MTNLASLFKPCKGCEKPVYWGIRFSPEDEVTIDPEYKAACVCFGNHYSPSGKRKDCSSMLCFDCASVENFDELGWFEVRPHVERSDINVEDVVLQDARNEAFDVLIGFCPNHKGDPKAVPRQKIFS